MSHVRSKCFSASCTLTLLRVSSFNARPSCSLSLFVLGDTGCMAHEGDASSCTPCITMVVCVELDTHAAKSCIPAKTVHAPAGLIPEARPPQAHPCPSPGRWRCSWASSTGRCAVPKSQTPKLLKPHTNKFMSTAIGRLKLKTKQSANLNVPRDAEKHPVQAQYNVAIILTV